MRREPTPAAVRVLVAGLHTVVRRYGQDPDLRAPVTDPDRGRPGLRAVAGHDAGVPPGWVDTMTATAPAPVTSSSTRTS
ncbi:hypothetical protein COUCH_27570 [Couchioplanes caeruleus]|uniref:hypothetical protein n=1 Tax=Couchioplanes caeruleus TaxID=56438 RepID=UPI0020C0C0AF|nr:hypothetical protein [Couchioplanes caeruleus]UQU62776.1 hypothetical protein COUCH_27570 [Couchioplanes caeruleus]